MKLRILKTSVPSQLRLVQQLLRRLQCGNLTHGGPAAGLDVPAIVAQSLSSVREDDDKAVVAETRKLHTPTFRAADMRVPLDEIQRVRKEYAKANPTFLPLIRRVIANIRAYQKSILVKAPRPLRRGGRTLGVRYTPINRVGVYVPGGRAVYPSSVLMTIVPAQVAGVREIVMVTPPGKDGSVTPVVLTVAGELGIAEIYRTSGVAGLAALAYGTKTIRRVDKIVGPGSAFVAEAKRQLFGQVGIDSIAGPSEVVIVADDSARPDFVAADLLAQAEHDPGSAVLITPSLKLANAVSREVNMQAKLLSRRAAVEAALRAYCAAVVTPDLASACELANEFAAEHLQIITCDDSAVLNRIRNAGAIFVGQYTPVPLGDYHAGPSHVLPTGGTSRFFGPLNCNDFRKASSIVQYDRASLAADADDVIDFAAREGLTAHAAAVRKRTDKGNRSEV